MFQDGPDGADDQVREGGRERCGAAGRGRDERDDDRNEESRTTTSAHLAPPGRRAGYAARSLAQSVGTASLRARTVTDRTAPGGAAQAAESARWITSSRFPPPSSSIGSM